jgi:hypothetical protein
MSNSILPTPQAQKWGITWPIKKSPGYKTLVQTPANNRGEVRISLTPYPIWVWDLDLDYLKGDMSTGQVSSALQSIVGFFGQMQGAASDFLYQDPYDNSCTGQLLGYGDGVQQQFQLVRNTGGMVDLMQAAFPTNVYLNGSLINPAPQTSGGVWYCGIENLLLSSQAFNNSYWTSVSTTVTDNALTAPDGTSTASQFAFASHGVNTLVCVEQTANISTVLPATVTFSVWLKVASGSQDVEIVAQTLNDNATGVTNTHVVPVTVLTPWQRFSVTLNIAQQQGTTVQVQIRSLFSTSQSAFSVYAWGAQLERWTAPTGYNPTTTTVYVANGLVTLGAAPAAGVAVTADFSFYYRVRLLDDQWKELSEDLYQIWSLKSLKFKSILL